MQKSELILPLLDSQFREDSHQYLEHCQWEETANCSLLLVTEIDSQYEVRSTLDANASS